MPLGLSAVVCLAGVFRRPWGARASLRFCVSCGGPRPASHSGWGPRPFPSSPARFRSRPSGSATLRESGSLQRAAGRKARLGLWPSAGSVAALPFAASSPLPSAFSRLARCPLRLVFRLPAACRYASASVPSADIRGCPSVRPPSRGLISFAPITSLVSCRPSVGTSILAWATFGFAISHARLESRAGLRVSCRSSRSLRGFAPAQSLIATFSSSDPSRGCAPNPAPCGWCLLVRTGAAPPNPC